MFLISFSATIFMFFWSLVYGIYVNSDAATFDSSGLWSC